MAYGNQYYGQQYGYAPGMMQPMQQVQPAPMQQQQQMQNLVRVQGEEAAKSYPVAPGATVPMMDIERPYLYVKSVGFDGVPFPLRKFRISEENEHVEEAPAWRTELDKLIARVAKLEGGLNNVEPTA